MPLGYPRDVISKKIWQPSFYRYDELFPGASGNPGRFFYNGAK